jgi:hypothetical protein
MNTVTVTLAFRWRPANYWEGHCLELDVFATADRLESAAIELKRVAREMYAEFLRHGGPEKMASRRAPAADFEEAAAHMAAAQESWEEVCATQDRRFFAVTTASIPGCGTTDSLTS